MRSLISLFFLLSFIGCSSGLESLNHDERAAARMVEEYIGTPVQLIKGIRIESGEENTNYYELEINSRLPFGNYPDKDIASGCALNFYNNLPPKQRDKFAAYDITINDEKAGLFETSFDRNTLETALKAYEIYDKIFFDLYNKDLDRLSYYIDPETDGYEREDFLELLIQMDSLYGELDYYRALSFETGETKEERNLEWVSFEGVAFRGEEVSKYNMLLTLDGDDYTIRNLTLK